MKYWFKFSDDSTAYLEDSIVWMCFRPTHRYSSQDLGFGEWEPY